MIGFAKQIALDGWALLESVVPERLVMQMCDDLDFAYATCKKAQKEGGIDEATDGTVHHLPAVRGRSFIELLEKNPAAPYISEFFGGKPYVLNSMGGQFNFPNTTNYAAQVHRDVRSYWSERLMLNTLVCLDDMNADNGATWLLPGSHDVPDKPDDAVFDECALQVSAPAGSILMWDSRIWHKAGVNRSKRIRRIVTPIFTRPFYKPEFDWPRAIGRESELSETLRQVLGYNARTPATLEEFYRPTEERYYRRDQG